MLYHFTHIDITIVPMVQIKSSYMGMTINISNKLIKSAKEVLVEPLTLLVNQMVESGHFPSELKFSRVKPLFENGDQPCS